MRDLPPVEKYSDEAANKHGDRQSKEQAAVVLDHNAQHRQMTGQCTADDAQGKQRAPPRRNGASTKYRRDQFRHARAVTPPRFKADFREDINRFLRPGEFEEQGLEEDDRRHDCGKTQLITNSDFVNVPIISLLVRRRPARILTGYFPFFSTSPGQLASAFARLPFVSLLKSSRTPLLYCSNSRPSTIWNASTSISTSLSRETP